MVTLTEVQLSLGTAEEQQRVFFGERGETGFTPQPETQLAAGTYRVIDGELVRVVAGVPPEL